MGDVNNDGYGDILICSAESESQSKGTAGGEVYLIHGNPLLPNSTTLPFDLQSSSTTTLSGKIIRSSSSLAKFGCSCNYLGDINGDGIEDWIIGASGEVVSGTSNSGKVYIIFGKTASTTEDLLSNTSCDSISKGFIYEGSSGEELGKYVAGIGDINNDGVQDFAVVAQNRVLVTFGRSLGFTSSIIYDIQITDVNCEWITPIGDIN